MTLLAVAVAGRGLVAPSGAVFSADDEALLRGSAAFESMRIYNGKPFLLERHLMRLAHSAAALGLPSVAGAEELAALVIGAAPPDAALRIFRTTEVLVATAAAVPPALEEERAQGIALRSFEREPPPLLAGVKSTSYAAAFAARQDALAHGADDALFVWGGQALECATANIWWAREGRLHTPAAGPGVLPGVTRGAILELEDADTASASFQSLLAADEAFTTSSIREVMPVISVDGTPIGDGRPGPLAARLQAALRLRSLA